MTTGETQPAQDQSPAHVWRNRALAILGVAVILVITYFILAAFIPRWWAQQVGRMVHGSFTAGIWWGLVYGFVCTLIPLILVMLAIRWRRTRFGAFIAGIAVVGAVVVALPNLMTLSVVLGGSSAAHAGQRIMDVDAPAFRGAALVGAIVAAVAFAALLALRGKKAWQRRHPGRHRAPETTPVAPETSESPENPAPPATPESPKRSTEE